MSDEITFKPEDWFRNLNKTFGHHNVNSLYPSLVACVGKEVESFNDYAYKKGFLEAFYILTSSLYSGCYYDMINQMEKASEADGLIYPICFCARHYIEISIKEKYDKFSKLIDMIYSIKNRRAPALQKINQGHDLRILWNKYLNVSKIDERFKRNNKKLTVLIMDFAEVDRTGQTFRYPYDNNNAIHLTKISCINVEKIANKFNQICKLFDQQDQLFEKVYDEYNTGMYILKNDYVISRYKIEKISKKIPNKNKWGSEQFKVIKNNIIKNFQLSGRDFSSILDLIQKHRKLSLNIGIENKIDSLDDSLISNLVKVINKNESTAVINDEEWKKINIICQIGNGNYPADFYDEIIELDSDIPQNNEYIFKNLMAKNYRFHKGLKKLGQVTFSKKLRAVLPDLFDQKL